MRVCTLVILVIGTAAALVAQERQAVTVAGQWSITIDDGERVTKAVLDLKQEGETITGTYRGPQGRVFDLTGTIREAKLAFSVRFITDAVDMSVQYDGDVTGDTMKGTGRGDHFTLSFTGQRVK